MSKNTCKSCGNQFSGNYCNVCGEKVIREEDKRLKHFIGEFINAISFADSKFWRTLKNITFNPGCFSKDFVDGKRRKYMRPIAIFLFANLIYFFFPLFNTFHSSLETQISSYNFIHSDLGKELVYQKIEKERLSLHEYEAAYNAKTKELSKIFLILIAMVFALFMWVIHNPNKYFLSEHIILSLELMAFILLFGVQLQGIIMHFLRFVGFGQIVSEALISSIAGLLILYFIIRSELTFFEKGKLRAALYGIIGVLGFTMTVYLYRIFLFFITFWSI